MYSKYVNKSDKTWSIFHTNLRGFSSKKISVKNIISKIKPNVITMNEVGLRKNKKVSLAGYTCYTRNRQNNESMGGVATAVIDEENSSTIKTLEGNDKDEFIVTRHSQFQRPINIINNYGETESRTDRAEIEEKWSRLTKILKDIENKGEEAIFIGDQNKLIGNSTKGMETNNSKVSFGGKLVLELVSEGNYVLVNGLEICKGGPFTRVEPNNPSVKSCLDLVIVSKGLLEYIVELVIDKERNFTPHRVVKGKKLTYTDHFSLHFILKGIPLRNPTFKKKESQVIWNTNKPGGWTKYREMTENNEVLDHIVETADKMTSNEMMNRLENVTTKVKFKCFGKVRNSRRMESDKELDILYSEKSKATTDDGIQEAELKIAGKLLEKQRKEYETKLEQLKNIQKSKGRSAAIFKLREKVIGSKKEGMESVAMKDPITGNILYDPDQLKKASESYLSNLLKNREPKEDYVEGLKTLRSLHEVRMSEVVTNNEHLTEQDFDKMLTKIKKKKAEKYKFTLNGGGSYRSALFCLYKKVWEYEQKPTSWENTSCTMLYKGKGLKSEFSNQRFIHSKEEVPKCFETLVMDKAKPKIISKCSKFQIGGLPGHQSAEHLFTLKSVISLFMSQGKPLLLNCFDLKKYFDSEVLVDAMDNLYKCGINGKLYRLIYELNKNNFIRIKTPVGITDGFRSGENVTQGSVGGGLISSLNLDIPIVNYFEDSEVEVKYGSIAMNPIIYQDDLARLASSVKNAQAGIDKVEYCMETKMLDLHDEKSCYLLIGKGKCIDEIKDNLKSTPLSLYGKQMVQKIQEKYLGDFLHCGGLAASARATVDARAASLRSGAVEVRAIVEDCRSRCLGGLAVGLEIFELAYIPALLNNAQTWMEIDNGTIEKLESLQCKFLQILFATPASTPQAALIWDSGTLKMKYRIMESKLNFLHYILTQSDESLAHQIMMEQKSQEFPGLVQECKVFIEELNILDPFQWSLTKNEWKSIVKKAILAANCEELKYEISEKYKKLKHSELAKESFGRKSYISDLNLQQARIKFKYRSSMTQHVKMNQKSNKAYENALWKCEDCGLQDTNSHLLWCPGYLNLREGKDLEDDRQLCDYLHKIFLLRNDKLLS